MIHPHEHSVLALLANPGRLIFGGWEFGVSWLFTRRWISLLYVAIPCFVLAALWGTALVGHLGDRERLLMSYWERIDEALGADAMEIRSNADADAQTDDSEVNESDSPSSSRSGGERASEQSVAMAGDDSNKISDFSDLLLQRVLQLDKSNLRATYWVARHLGSQGRVGQARWMMRRIASDKTRGFAPAHAWLAQDHIAQFKQGVVPLNDRQLGHDLEHSVNWSGIHPLLLTTYAELLLKSGRVGDSIRIFQAATEREPLLRLQFANFAKSLKNADGTPNPVGVKAFEEIAKKLRDEVKTKVADKTAGGDEVAAIAQLALLEANWRQAIAIAERAMTLGEPSLFVRRTLSDAYLAKYVDTADLTQRKFDLVTLDAALKADGTNQRVTEEVAKLISMGATATPELTAILEEKLASGQANAVTHLFIGNQKMLSDRLQEAVGHFEVAMRLAPASPVVLNNFALALTRFKPNDPEALKHAEQCMELALRVAEPKLRAELYDSLGEIRATAGDSAGAIASFEDSIRLNGQGRTKTRRKLIDAYRVKGMENMAVAQERIIAQGE